MAAITDLSDLINRMTGGSSGTPEVVFGIKVQRIDGAAATAPINGRMASLWRYDGTYGNGAIPTVAAIPTNATAGAMPITNPGGGREKWMAQVWGTASSRGTLLLYDRLLHIGGLSGASAVDQTVQGPSPSPALTRNTGGVGNVVFYEIYSLIGTTGTTLTMTYTNSAGTTGRTSTVNIGATGFREATRLQAIPLAAGDVGVQAVDKIKLTATTGTAGDFGITIARPLAYVSINEAGLTGWRDFTTGLPGLPKIDSNACLALAFSYGSTSAAEFTFGASFVEA